jgi:hypothetical protein
MYMYVYSCTQLHTLQLYFKVRKYESTFESTFEIRYESTFVRKYESTFVPSYFRTCVYYLRRYDRSDTELSVTVVHVRVHVRVVLYTYVYSTKVSIISNFRISSSTIRVVLNKSTARILTVKSRFVCTSHRKSELNALCGRSRTKSRGV